jgi:hypothetical protein
MASKSPTTIDTDRILHVLTTEYNSLNAQIIARLSARYQFLGFLTAGSAILAAASGRPIFSTGTWVLAALAIGVFAFGLFCFWYLGQTIATLAVRVANIEKRINKLVSVESADAPRLLSWESDQQRRTGISLFLFGPHGNQMNNDIQR